MRESLRRLKSGKGRLQGEVLVAMEVLSEEENRDLSCDIATKCVRSNHRGWA